MKNLLLFICWSLSHLVLAQKTTIQGQVTDQRGEEIVGANIFLKDTYDGTSSMADGRFSFATDAAGTQVLQLSYIGYENYEMTVELTGEPIELTIRIKEIFNQLDAVVISAGSFEASDEKKSVVLKPLDIVLTAGAQADIAGALNTLPGTQRVGEAGQLFVRGGAAYETKTFIDGMLVQNPYTSAAPNLPARGRFSPFLFKGTLFSTGAYSAEYGQALSSALLLETQDLAPESLTSVSLMSIGAGLSRTHRWDSSSLSVEANYTNLAPYTALMPQNIRWEKPFRGIDGQVIFRHQFSPTGMLKYHGTLSRNAVSMDRPLSEDVLQNALLDLDNRYTYHTLSAKEIVGEKWTVTAGLAYSFNRDAINQGFSYQTKDQTAQARLTASYQISDKISTKLGGSYWWNEYQEEFKNGENDFFGNLTEHNKAFFSETNIYLSKKLVARLGVRAEHSNLLKQWNLAPRTSVAYQTSQNSQVSVAYGSFYQTPENDLLRYEQKPAFEKAHHYLINYQLIKNKRTFRVEAYAKQYRDLVTFATDTPWNVNNEGAGYAKGIDLFFRDQKSIKNGDYWLSYSLLDTERSYRDFPQQARPGFASTHNFSAVYKHFLRKHNIMLGGTYSFSSARDYNDPNTSIFNDRQTKAYHDLSINASYLTNLFGQFTVLHLSVSNVLGIDQRFGRQYSSRPTVEGHFNSIAIQPTAARFAFVGLFISFGKTYNNETEEVQ